MTKFMISLTTVVGEHTSTFHVEGLSMQQMLNKVTIALIVSMSLCTLNIRSPLISSSTFSLLFES